MGRSLSLGVFLGAAIALWWLPSAAAPQSPSPEKPLSIIVTASEPEARRVLERVNRGDDFAALARDRSIDPSAHDGGYLGNLDPANLRRELREAVNGVAAGQVSGIVKIPSGYAILKVLNQPPPKGPDGKGPNQAAPTRMQAVAGAGAVRLTYGYAGFAAALLAVNKFDKPAGWDRDLHQACEVRVQSVAGVLEQLQLLMARPNPTAAFARDANALRADLHAYRGDMNEAIGYWQAAYEVALANFPDKAPQLEESLGVAYLQKAGSVLYRDFVFPRALPASAVHEPQREDLRKAAEYFLRYLKREPADGEVRWLLNLTYMLSGQYPGGVPKEFLIAPAVWESKEDVVHFLDVAAAAGVDRHGQAGGAIVDDFDNDSVLDIVVSNVNDCEPIAYYHGNGDGTFTNLAARAGLANVTGGLNIIQTDYNNDGCKDILVLRGGWEYPRPKSLLRNNCDGTFTDVTRGSGLEEPLTATQTAVWADIDNDGKLDLFVGNENAASQLFLN
ncbi:MAG TPA: FG-GAP-like repeat-containing protein, partial [Candidatus Solibacter sp.]|nr:FG-GAP-like repeat-containing protein [Candidatus Solibacter sp.]